MDEHVEAECESRGTARKKIGWGLAAVLAMVAGTAVYMTAQPASADGETTACGYLIRGGIYDAYVRHSDTLGCPLHDEYVKSDGQGAFQSFEGGIVYWKAAHGAYPVFSGIGTVYAFHSYTDGDFGYPIGEEYVMSPEAVEEIERSAGWNEDPGPLGTAWAQDFECGTLYFSTKPDGSERTSWGQLSGACGT